MLPSPTETKTPSMVLDGDRDQGGYKTMCPGKNRAHLCCLPWVSPALGTAPRMEMGLQVPVEGKNEWLKTGGSHISEVVKRPTACGWWIPVGTKTELDSGGWGQ